MRLITKKSLIIFVMALVILNLYGCKNKEQAITDQNLPTNEEVETTIDPSLDEAINEAIDETAEAVDESLDTVTEDIYGEDDGFLFVEHIEVDMAENTIELTDKELSDIKKMVFYAYFNYLWTPNSDDGTIEKEQMQLFAISYIYQYEYNELFFDTNLFELHIPDQKVTEIIRIFFDESFVTHFIESDIVSREVGFYKMPAVDGGVIADPVIVEIIKTSDFSYQVIFESSETGAELNQGKVQYSINIEERANRYIYTGYKTMVAQD